MKFIPLEEIKHKKKTLRVHKVDKHDDRQLEKTCMKMLNYLAKEDNHTIVEVDRLLNDMHRCVICIQRKKRKMIEKR